MCKGLATLSSRDRKLFTNFKPNLCFQKSIPGSNFGAWVVREEDARLREWLASTATIHIVNGYGPM